MTVRKPYQVKRISAYFTVEASLVLTLVIGVVLWLVYLMFYQYDRCLADQDMGALALKGCTLQAEDKEALMGQLEAYASQLDLEKYIAWEQEKIEIELKENKVRVGQAGRILFPFAGAGGQEGETEWKTESVFENRRVSPVAFLRTYRKITGGR